MVWGSRLQNWNVTMSLYISNDITFKNWNATELLLLLSLLLVVVVVIVVVVVVVGAVFW